MIRLAFISAVSCAMVFAVRSRPARCDEIITDGVYSTGVLAGSLKDDAPLPLYDADPGHLWNRIFSVLYVRSSNLPDAPGGKPIQRIEGGDVIDFLAWGRTTYWSSPEVFNRLNPLLDEFLGQGGATMIDEPLRRAVFLRDLWAAFDHLVERNIRRLGSLETRRRRDELCRKLARAIQSLALTSDEMESLPDTYAVALDSQSFVPDHRFDASRNYLPHGLLSEPHEWVEIDFYQPDLHEDLADRFITLHTRAYRGRSYFRIFYRFPGGRAQLTEYLRRLDAKGVDWRQAAQNGFIDLREDSPQFPAGTEFALVQFMMTLDEQLHPAPTKIVESIRLRVYRNVDGSSEPPTNTERGMNALEYTLKRRLLFDDLRNGGLNREPDKMPAYRVIFQGPQSPDWGYDRRKPLVRQCADCHTSPKGTRAGVRSVPSIVNMGGFDAGAQLGIAVPLAAEHSDVRARRAVRWKTRHETYRRLLEYLE